METTFGCGKCHKTFHVWCMPDIDHHHNCYACEKIHRKKWGYSSTEEEESEEVEENEETDDTDSTNYKKRKVGQLKKGDDDTEDEDNEENEEDLDEDSEVESKYDSDDSNNGSNFTTWSAYLKKWGHLINDWGGYKPTKLDICTCQASINKYGPNAACFKSNKKSGLIFFDVN